MRALAWLRIMAVLAEGRTVALQGRFRAQDGLFVADHTSFQGAKTG